MIIQKFGGVAMQDEVMRLNCIDHIKKGYMSSTKLSLLYPQLGAMVIPIQLTAFYNLPMPSHPLRQQVIL